jgi:predicted alpha/beta hydrolase family esterase
VIFVQGYGDYTDGVWPGWLSQELKKTGFDFSYLEMPNVMCPEVSEWLDFLRVQKIKVNRDTYFVGHSLGCITIARYLEALPEKALIGGCVMVSGFCSIPKVPLLSDFCDLPLDYEKVKAHSENFVMIISDNDHLIPRVDSEELASKLGAEIIVEYGKGHFKSDVKEVHSVLNIIFEWDQMREEALEIKKLKRFV